jgi:hypothetical protein
MKRWYIKVETEKGVKTAEFYHADFNPIQKTPERFGHQFIDLPNNQTIFKYVDRSDIPDRAIKNDDIRYAVDSLDLDKDYWIVDAYDELGEHFPTVPDIPGHSHPTEFVGIPRKSVIEVFSR